MKIEKSFREMSVTIKYTVIHILIVPEEEEREKKSRKVYKYIMATNSNLLKNTDLDFQGIQ